MISKKLFLAAFVIILFPASIFAQGINWGLRFDANVINRTNSDPIDIYKKETLYPRFFSSPQLMLNVYPIKYFGIEFRTGYEWIIDDFRGGEYAFYGKIHFYQPFYLLGGVCLKKIENSYERFAHIGTKRFGMPAIGIGGQVTKHISIELIYMDGNKRHIGYKNLMGYEGYLNYPYLQRDKYLNYVIKLSAGFNWSIYDF
jgi:hypothetical protein